MTKPQGLPSTGSGQPLFGVAGVLFLIGAAVQYVADLAYRAELSAGDIGPASGWIVAYTCVAVGAGLGIALILARDALQPRAAVFLPFIAIVLLAVPMLEGHRMTATGAILLLWPVLYAGCLLSETVTWITTGSSVLALIAASIADPRRTLVGYGPTAATLILTVTVVVALQRRMHGLMGQLARQARTDPLTGLANRRALLDALERESAAHRRRHAALSLLMIDVDRFKRLNDAAGHEAGDEVLRRLAALLQRETRVGDLAARFGGEEFTVVMTDCPLADAAVRAEQLRALIAGESGGWPHRITISIGIAELRPTQPSPTRARLLIQRADAALYAAKRSGRNQVKTSPS